MVARLLAAFTLVIAIGNELCAQQDQVEVQVGDHLAITLTGDLAKEYAQRTGLLPDGEASDGIQIETTATIAQELDDGRIRIEHTSHVNRNGEQARLVTLTATVDPAKITSAVTPKGTRIFASPGSKPILTSEEMRTLRLQLSDLKGLHLRTWTLSDEIGE